MARVVFLLAVVVAAIVQATLLPSVVPGLAMPSPVLVLVLLRTARDGLADGLIAAAVGGVVLDVLALDPLGVNGVALLAAVFAGTVASRPVFHSRVVFPMFLAVLATVLHAGLLSVVRLLGGDPVAGIQGGVGLAVLQGLANALLVPPFYVAGLALARFAPQGGR